MDADLIAHEAQTLLQEIAAYEEPRLFLDETPTLSSIAKRAPRHEEGKAASRPVVAREPAPRPAVHKGQSQVKDTTEPKAHIKDRQEAVLSVIREKKHVGIKDISTLIRGVSEKTIQRELAALVAAGIIEKQGERRWSVYSLA